MLEHLSPKFQMPPVEREPRAALILNRFTRNLTIMFATNAVASVLGLPPDEVKDKAFYRCIQERCLPEAVRCLESAKANDSIAYLRFWSRDPRDEDVGVEGEDGGDHPLDEVNGGSSPSDSDNGGAPLGGHMDIDRNSSEIKREEDDTDASMHFSASGGSSVQGSIATGSSSRANNRRAYETPLTQRSPASAAAEGQSMRPPPVPRRRRRRARPLLPTVELEAVVSCTSDGLVVILRRARPAIPPAHPPLSMPAFEFENGLFAAPWAQQPVRPYVPPEMLYTFRAPLLPQYMPLRENVKAAGGPPIDHLMRSIRDVAVFAWALVGINGNLAAFSQGRPLGEAAPPDGLPIWDPHAANPSSYQPPENQAYARWMAYDEEMDRGKGPAVPQARPDPYFARYHRASAGSHHDPGSHHGRDHYGRDHYGRDHYGRESYGRDNYGMHDASGYGGQPQPYQPVGHGYIPPHHQEQQQQHSEFRGSSNQAYPAEPWQNELRPGRSPRPMPGAFPTSQPPERPDSPPHHFDPGWLGGPYRG